MAQDILGRTIRNADYWGCFNHANVNSVLDSTHASYDPTFHDFSTAIALQFDVVDGSGDAFGGSVTGGATGTVGIQFKGVSSSGVTVTKDLGNDVNIEVSAITPSLVDGGVAMITDCTNSVIFQMSKVTDGQKKILQHNTGNTVQPGNIKGAGGCPNGSSMSVNCFPAPFGEGSQVFTPFSQIIYIREGQAGRRSLNVIGVDGVSIDISAGLTAQEIVADVVDMQVQVGSGSQGDNIINNWQTLTAANLATINSTYVKAVKVSLLVRSPEDGVAGSLQSACYPAWSDCSAGDNWTPASTADRHYYRVYTSTYSVRNRLLNTGP